MLAIVARHYGPPETMSLEEWPSTTPGPDEVRIRIHSAGITFADILIAAGKHQYKPPLPFVPGSEFSGEIIEVGKNVRGLDPGDRVCGGRQGGILAEQVTLPATRVQKLPAQVDMDQAAILRASYITAWYGLVECGRIQTGETVLVLGAAGAVGVAFCQLAKHLGARVIASATSTAKRELALQNGADYALDTLAADWRDKVKQLTESRGVDIVVDPVGGEVTEKAFRSLGYRGRHLVVGFASGEIPKLPTNLPLIKGASLIGVLAQYFDDRDPEGVAAARDRIMALFADGVLNPPVGKVFPASHFVQAMQAVENNEILGRVVIRMNQEAP